MSDKVNRRFDITAVVDYASKENAMKVVEKKGFDHLRHFIMTQVRKEGTRYFPVFVGQEAVDAGVHFHFNVVG